MTPPAVGAGTLQQLGAIGGADQNVLSVYLDLDPTRFPTPASRETELDALLADAERAGAAAEVARVRRLLEEDADLLRRGLGLAIFSCAETDTLETVTLPAAVEPLAVLDTVPWLEPLAALVTAENWGVAVLSRRSARLFRGGRRALVEFATVTDDVHGRHRQGGWSQPRYQRGIEHEVSEHVSHVVERLLRAHRRRAFEQLVIVAAPELWPTVEGSLAAELRERLAGHVEHDLEHASSDEIADAVRPVVEGAEQERERSALARLEEALAHGGPAAAGADEVRALLEQRRVATLLVPDTPREPEIEQLVDVAASSRAETLVVHHEAAALRAHGPVAALLHW